MARKLGQPDLDELSAYLDGELPAERAAEVARRVGEDPAWREACERMQAVDLALEGWSAAPAPEGLADRILARVRAAELSAADFDDLSAYLDGELSAERAAEVGRFVQGEPVWRRTHQELRAVGEAMEGWSVPAADEGLADRALARVRRASFRSRVVRIAAWVGPAAAVAAAVLLAVAVLNSRLEVPGKPASKALLGRAIRAELHDSPAYRDVPQAERAALEQEIVRSFGVLRGLCDDRDIVEQFETLQAIEQIESKGT